MKDGEHLSRLLRAVWLVVWLCGCGEVPSPNATLAPSPSASVPSLAGNAGAPEDGGSSGGSSGDGGSPAVGPADCDAGDAAFVRRAVLALLGRRPLGQGEVGAFTGAITQIRSAQASAGAADTARLIVARAMMRDDAFRVRWSDFLKDSLRVGRTQGKSQESCYGEHESAAPDGGALARFVRDNEPSAANPPVRGFTMRELLASALELDDLSVVYRAHLFAMLNKPLTGNSLALELELARRNDFGATFETAYTQREIGCLGCHNSEYSVTGSVNPEANRFWPVPGLLERAVFGDSSGMHPPEEASEKGSDVLRARGMFRVMGVVGSGSAPFGWSEACGVFSAPASEDPLHIDTWFGSIRSTPEDPSRGQRASVLDLERSLHLGVELLKSKGLTVHGNEASPDEAFATLVALTIVEKVWIEVIGTPLTIAHHFPRTAVQRDLLVSLTDRFVRAHFSLKELLIAILTQPIFNLAPPSAGCGSGPYPLDRIFDPWTDFEVDPELRGNGPSDGVFPLSPRLLRRALHSAMGWPMYPEYPKAESAEETLSSALGFFLRDGEPGRRGLDFQGRLAWEAAYGSCPALWTDDFIARLASDARAQETATVFDAVVALKDRLIGDPRIHDVERALLEALIGSPLGDRSDSLETGLRRVCGALVSSPMFMLGGLPPGVPGEVPKLTPPEATQAAACAKLTDAVSAVEPSMRISCAE